MQISLNHQQFSQTAHPNVEDEPAKETGDEVQDGSVTAPASDPLPL